MECYQLTIWDWIEMIKEQVKKEVKKIVAKEVKSMFMSESHEKVYREMLEKRFGKGYENGYEMHDSEYSSAFYVLAFLHKGLVRHVSKNGIRFLDILEKEYLSTGEKFLVEVAMNLYQSSGQLDLSDMLYLSGDFYSVFQNAIRIRRGESVWQK